MEAQDLIFVDCITNHTENEMVLFFEPRCEEIKLCSGEKIEILAEVETTDPRFELKPEGNTIAIFCLTSDVLWYANKSGVIKPTMEWVYGITHEAMAEWYEKHRKPWWKFW